MTKVDFYILRERQTEQRSLFACRLANQLFGQGRSLYLHTGDEAAARALDEILWGYRPQAFLPHGILGEGDDSSVAIGWGENPGHHQDVMINLDLKVPPFAGRFQRIVEVVVQDPSVRDPLRESYKFYKDRGYPLSSNEIQPQ